MTRIRLCTSLLVCGDEEQSDVLAGEDVSELKEPTDEEDDDEMDVDMNGPIAGGVALYAVSPISALILIGSAILS